VNRVYVKGKHYESRYQFSNRSDDIRKLFTDTCEKLAVEWRQWTRYHISVARRESVAILDSVVGPKY
jgi:ligand-binding SRPBCC domain-containing protein